jgi:oxygen-independent coproporphyrinogen III oxidase
VAAWVGAVGRELEWVAADRGWRERLALRTLYLGGGTPSLLGVGAMGRLLEETASLVDTAGLEELTAEANPESFTPELARDWVGAGVDRVSLGAQTFHGPSLAWMGRLHGPDGPARAVGVAREAGLDNVGLDLIFGLPERLGRNLERDLDRILELAPDHVSVYGLTVEEGTPLGRWVAERREAVPDPERYRDEYLLVARMLRGAGYVHYEVSNFARPGKESRHNAAYWSGVPYLGVGNGAHSFDGVRRWWNHRDWLEYRSVLERGESPCADQEVVGPAGARLERIWLGLRTAEGLARHELAPPALARVDAWIASGWASPDPDRVRLTVEGWLLLDRLTVELDMAA